MLEAILISRANQSGRLVLQETPESYQLMVRWFGIAFPIASVTKKELDAARRPKLGLVS